MQTSAELTDLMARTEQLVPALQGRVGLPQPGDIVPGADNSALIGSLLEHYQQRYPEAGPHYWSMHCWALLIWQPVILGLTCVHQLGRSIGLDQLAQQAGDGTVAGYRLPPQELGTGPQQRLIADTAGEIRNLTERLLTQLARHISVNPVLARRLLADRVLATLLHLQQYLPDVDNPRLASLGRLWLSALSLEQASDLMAIQLPGGDCRLALDRKACCQHFRRRDGSLCASCPRQRREVRIERLQQQWSQSA
jgi:siderophore ferric iron reductase